jgi:2,6-dihydroxypyridine 3-monooxygenase
MDIAVIGGSLGGLAAGCFLADAGHRVVVYERSPSELEERGAGIGFLPETYRYFAEHASIDVRSMSVSTEHIRHLARDGNVAHDRLNHYFFSSWNTVYRELLRAFSGFPAEQAEYRLGHEMVGFDVSQPEVRFANGLVIHPDLAVFADGVSSAARTTLLPACSRTYAGYVAWRGVVPETSLSQATRDVLDDALTYYTYANSHVLVYPIPGRDGSVVPGERLINIVWYRNYLAGDDLNDLLLDDYGHQRDVSVPPGALRAHHVAHTRAEAAARLPAPIAEVVHAIDDLFIQVVFDVEVSQMAFGRTCLLGDAAFIGRPHAAAGTAKAAEDAYQLRNALAAHPTDLQLALKHWETGQLEVGRNLVARTRRIGRRSQVDCTWSPEDPEIIFGLYAPGGGA